MNNKSQEKQNISCPSSAKKLVWNISFQVSCSVEHFILKAEILCIFLCRRLVFKIIIHPSATCLTEAMVYDRITSHRRKFLFHFPLQVKRAWCESFPFQLIFMIGSLKNVGTIDPIRASNSCVAG